MKITFDQTGLNYIDVSQLGEKICVSISAQSEKNPRQTVINSAELTKEQLLELINEFINSKQEETNEN